MMELRLTTYDITTYDITTYDITTYDITTYDWVQGCNFFSGYMVLLRPQVQCESKTIYPDPMTPPCTHYDLRLTTLRLGSGLQFFP